MENLEKQSVLVTNNKNIIPQITPSIQYCHFGCGQIAKYQFKNGKWCCSKHWSSCPQLKRKNSLAILAFLKNNNLKHTSRGNYGHRGQKAWNKGLTKDTDDRVKYASDMLKLSYAAGKSKPTFFGKKHTEITRQKMSSAALKRTIPRVSKKRYDYKCIDGNIVKMDSSYEVMTAELLDRNNINWIRPEPIVWIDDNKKEHHYFPDFYLPDYNLYLDPKNDWCIVNQKMKLDKLHEQYNNIEILRYENINIEYISKLIRGRVAEFGLKQLPTK